MRFYNNKNTFFILLLAIAWRIYLFLVAYVASVHTSFLPRFPYADIFLLPSKLPQFLWAWGNFDGVHYLTIARHGYAAQFTQVFFPLYPLLMRGIGILFHDTNLLLSGISVSFIMFIISLFLFYKLMRIDLDESASLWSILFLLIFPTSFYFAAIYTESLFLFCMVAAFWYARKNSWWVSAVFGMLAALTRFTGILLLVPLVCEWITQTQHDSKPQIVKRKNRLIRWAYLIFSAPVTYLVPLGTAIYMSFLQLMYGDWLYFWHAQPVFGAERSGGELIFPPQVLWRYMKILVSIPPTSEAFFIAITEILAFVFTVILLLLGHRYKIRLSYLLLGWLMLLIPVFSGTFSSLPRYILPIFPIYIVLGKIRRKYVKVSIILAFFLIQILLITRFVSGRWVA